MTYLDRPGAVSLDDVVERLEEEGWRVLRTPRSLPHAITTDGSSAIVGLSFVTVSRSTKLHHRPSRLRHGSPGNAWLDAFLTRRVVAKEGEEPEEARKRAVREFERSLGRPVVWTGRRVPNAIAAKGSDLAAVEFVKLPASASNRVVAEEKIAALAASWPRVVVYEED